MIDAFNGAAQPRQPEPPARSLRIETADPGVFVDLDAEARDAAVQALKDCDAPIARADELVAAVTGRALSLVVAMRVEQIVKHGHTPATDESLPLLWLPNHVQANAQGAIEAIGVTGSGRNVDLAIRRLARSAALSLAAIDRLLTAKARGEV